MILLFVLATLLVAANGEPYQASPSSNHHFPPIFYPSTTPAPSLSGVGITTKVPAPHYAAPPLPANLILTPSAGPLHQLPFKQPSDYAAVSPAHPAHQAHTHYNAPTCVGNNYYNTTFTSTWCEEDFEYPVAEIETAIMFHFYSVASMYKVILNNTHTSNNSLCLTNPFCQINELKRYMRLHFQYEKYCTAMYM